MNFTFHHEAEIEFNQAIEQCEAGLGDEFAVVANEIQSRNAQAMALSISVKNSKKTCLVNSNLQNSHFM